MSSSTNTPSTAWRSPEGLRFGPPSADMRKSSPYFSQYAYPQFGPGTRLDVSDEPPTTTLPGGTLLHQGFYDLLAMIPTPSLSRLFGVQPGISNQLWLGPDTKINLLGPM
jgi:hypothetical protein